MNFYDSMPFASNLPPKARHILAVKKFEAELEIGVKLIRLASLSGVTRTQCECVLEKWIGQGKVEYDAHTKMYRKVISGQML
jgi:hypothetical protein